MSRGERIMGEKEYSADVVRDLIGHTNYVFMLANQLPLLELSEVSNPLPLGHASATAVKALAEIRRQNKPTAHLQRQQSPFALRLVAVSDPNDLLSYPLDQSSISGSTIEYSRYRERGTLSDSWGLCLAADGAYRPRQKQSGHGFVGLRPQGIRFACGEASNCHAVSLA